MQSVTHAYVSQNHRKAIASVYLLSWLTDKEDYHQITTHSTFASLLIHVTSKETQTHNKTGQVCCQLITEPFLSLFETRKPMYDVIQ